MRELGREQTAAGVKVPRHKAGPPETITDADYQNVVRVPDRRSQLGRRDHALLRMLGDCGLRSAELRSLVARDLRRPRSNARHQRLYVRGKGGTEREVPVPVGELGLELKRAKTRITHLREGGEGFDFLGFHHRYVRGNTPRSQHFTFLVRWPSRQAMQHARQRVREITARERLLLPVEEIVQDLNRFLGGWADYFRYGNSAQFFDKISLHAVNRLSIFVANRHQRDRRFGWWVVARQSPNRLGLIDLNGIIVPPRANQLRHRAR
jgi:hypothetical protein